MKRVFALSILAAALAATPASAASCGVRDLAWLQGTWHSADAQSSGEERWLMTPASTLAGSSWVIEHGAMGFVEALSIAPAAGGAVEMHLRHFDGALDHAWEDKDTPMVFTLAHCDGQSAVFDGAGAKLGEHITYSRAGDGLTFVGDFLRHGNPMRVEIHFQKG